MCGTHRIVHTNERLAHLVLVLTLHVGPLAANIAPQVTVLFAILAAARRHATVVCRRGIDDKAAATYHNSLYQTPTPGSLVTTGKNHSTTRHNQGQRRYNARPCEKLIHQSG